MTTAPGARGLSHLPQLDGMRALAIAIVLLGHSHLIAGVPGGFGVTLFFFLSGYLITSLLRIEAAQSGRVSLAGFYLRRTVRIVPPMVITVLFTIGLQVAGLLPMQASIPGAASDLLFLTNYADVLGLPGSVRIPLWSLDVEEHFYILFSSLYGLWLFRRKPAWAAAVCALGCLGVLALRHAYAVLDPGALEQVYYWSHTRIDSILYGCILALWCNPVLDARPLRPGPALLLVAAALLLASFLYRDPVFRETWRYSLQGIGLMIVFAWVIGLEGRAARLLGCWPLRWIALLSYTLYLIHFPLLQLCERLGLGWLWAYALSVIYALAMHGLIEKPLARWRRSFEGKMATGAQAA